MHIMAISDLHIGHVQTRTAEIHQFLETAADRADILVLNGDILDLWRMRYSKIKSTYSFTLDHIKEISEKMPVVWILGNHDYGTPKYEFPNVLFKREITIGNTHFEHGHRFDAEQVRYMWGYKYIEALFPPIHQMLFKSPAKSIEQKAKSQKLSMHSRARAYGAVNNVNVVVGHSHQPQQNLIYGSKWVVDCGDFLHSLTYAEIIDDVPLLRWV